MLYDEIKKNKRNSIVMMIIFGSLLMLFPLLISLDGSPEDKADLPSTLLTWVIFITAYVAIQYATSMWAILRMSNAKSITEDDDPELYHIVQDMSMVAGLPMPKIYIIDTAEPNAFATGTSYKRSAIAVTTGIRELMTREELEGVISHEMSHIKNYDIRVSTIAAAFVGFVELLGNSLIQLGKWTMYSFHLSEWTMRLFRDDNKTNFFTIPTGISLMASGFIIGILFMVCGFIIMAVGVPVGMLMQAFISRQRESLADVSGANLTRNPEGLISAFKKLEAYEESPHDDSRLAKSTAASMCLITPKGMSHWFDSHPPLEDRIERLRKL